MAKRPGGFGGGSMQQMMKQAQKLQQDMMKAKEELAETEVTATAGGGMVEITMTCERVITNVSIKPEIVDPDDVEMLEDLIMACFNEACTLVDKETEEKMGAFGDLGGFGF